MLRPRQVSCANPAFPCARAIQPARGKGVEAMETFVQVVVMVGAFCFGAAVGMGLRKHRIG